MQVANWGNSLAVRLPKALVDQLGLKPGDEIKVVRAEHGRLEVVKGEDERRSEAIDRMAALKIPLPKDYKFDREEANSR